MPRARVEILPWLTRLVSPDHAGKLSLSIEVRGNTVRDLLETLADQYPRFAEKIYDPATRDVTDLVEVALNGRMLNAAELAGTTVQDGDCVMLLPAFGGG